VQALGGAKNHMVVMPDADIEQTVDALIGSAYGSAGERCMAISVAVFVGDVGDQVIPKLVERARTLKVKDGMELDAEMGPIVTRPRTRASPATSSRGQRRRDAAGGRPQFPGRERPARAAENGFWLGGTLFDRVTPRHAHLQGRNLRPGAGVRARARFRRRRCSWSTTTNSATA
jgi:malonate-semialdehyde dehydrogenase (acetylating)/methylmalonate-semialdehyde dehydrogenase